MSENTIPKGNPDMHVDLMYPSKYLKAADLVGKDVTLTIKAVTKDELRDQGGGTKKKYVVRFEKTDKMFVLGPTTAHMVAAALDEPKAIKWAGKKITLFPTTCDAFGEIKACIRVRTEAQ